MNLKDTPTAEQQLDFLQNIQRILREGNFVSTYKFALLHALADLSVLKGDDSGATLVLTTEELAEQFLLLYERQTLPFPGTKEVLKQNTGKQAAIIQKICEVSADYAGRRIDLIQNSHLLGRIKSTIREMPLWKLQRVGDDFLDFLYDNTYEYSTTQITLKPGIAFCFRTFYSFVTSMIQQAWITYIRRFNRDIIGESADIQEFLFGVRRSFLTPLRDILYDLQEGRCFYTDRPLTQDFEVDHFIPWSRYPLDLGHNFVLANREVNRTKSDHIAAEEHLKHWVDFCLDYDADLIRQFRTAGMRYNLHCSFQIAYWCYSNAQKSKAQVWKFGRKLTKLSGDWEKYLEGVLHRPAS